MRFSKTRSMPIACASALSVFISLITSPAAEAGSAGLAIESEQSQISSGISYNVSKEYTSDSILKTKSNPKSQAVSLNPGEVSSLIVKFSSDTGVQKQASFGNSKMILNDLGIANPEEFHEIGFGYSVVSLGEAVSETHAERVVDQLLTLPEVIEAEVDSVISLNSTPKSFDPISIEAVQTGASWGLDRIDQRSLPLNNSYSYDSDGTGVKIYVIDSGINSSHREFQSRIPYGWYTTSLGGFQDCDGHGTHVAGTAGGANYGVAKNATIIPMRVFDCSGTTTNSAIISMLNSLVSDHQAGEPAVANMSLGGEASSALDSAVQAVINDGVTVVVASGNDGEYSCNYSPARVAAAITVNSSDRYDDDSSFSNYGACSDIYAPGESIISAWITSNSAVEYLSGTSMASPFVAGVAARILERNPRFTPSQVWSAINNTATTVSFLPSAGDPDKLLFASSNSITWNANGGTSVEPGPSVYEAGGSIGSLPLTTTKAGHTFAGWWVDPTFSTGSAITSQYTPGFPYGPVTLYAKWSASNNITWNVNGGALVSPGPSVYEAGGSIGSLPLTAAKVGYTFAGWWIDPTFSTGSAITSQYTPGFPYGPITLYAKWSANTYTVTYNYNSATGGNRAVDASFTTDGPFISLPTPTRTGYTFSGWYSDAGFVTKIGNGGGGYSPTGEVLALNVYAKWWTNTYTVTYNYNSATGGNRAVDASFTTDGAAISLPTPTRTGYTFSGWYSDAGFVTKIGNGGGGYSPTGEVRNLYVYAKWSKNVKPSYVSGAKPTGTAKVGRSITASPGRWNGTALITHSYQWYLCKSANSKVLTTGKVAPNCTLVKNARNSSFNVTTKQKGGFLAVAITGSNLAGKLTIFTPTTGKIS